MYRKCFAALGGLHNLQNRKMFENDKVNNNKSNNNNKNNKYSLRKVSNARLKHFSIGLLHSYKAQFNDF